MSISWEFKQTPFEKRVLIVNKQFILPGDPIIFSCFKVSNLNFEEFNGIPGKNAFDASPKLTKRIAAELSKPFMFEYAKGRVGDIRTSAEISDTIVNIVRGILGFFQVTVKTTQRVYELEEVTKTGFT